MTQNKWYALELLSGIATMVAIWPLDRPHFWTAVISIPLFAIFYFQRLTKQLKRRG